MKNIQLSNQPLNEDWSMRFVDETDYDQLFDESVFVRRPDGSPLMVLLKSGISHQSISLAWKSLKGLRLITRNRGLAAGRENDATRKDGSKSNTLDSPKGWEVASGIVGYFERSVRMPYCRACAWNLKYPDRFQRLLPMAQEVSKHFEEQVPERFAVQKSFVERTHGDFVIPGTVFTTLTINKNFRTACHKDAGDLEQGFSCMSVIRVGSYQGGNLVLPNWRIGANLGTGDVILFDAHEFHGNTQLIPLSKNAERCSIVYYYREAMAGCKSAKEEMESAKNRKPGDSIW